MTATSHKEGETLVSNWLDLLRTESKDRRGLAARLMQGSTVAQLDTVIASIGESGVGRSEGAWELVTEAWERAATYRTHDWTFTRRVANWIKATSGVDQSGALRLANRLAWATTGEPFFPNEDNWAEVSVVDREVENDSLFLVAIYGYRPRFLFQRTRLAEVLDEIPREVVESWPLCQALSAFSILGRAQSTMQSNAVKLIESAWSSSVHPGCEDEIHDLCIQALDAAEQPEALASLVIELVSSLPEQDRTAILRYRLAKAYRREADCIFDDMYKAKRYRSHAMTELGLSSDSLRGDNAFTRSFGEQLRMERESLLIAQYIGDQSIRLRDAERSMKDSEQRVRQEAASNSIRSTEVLALFSSAVAFAVGAAAIGASAKSAAAAVATGVALLVGLLGFATLLMLSARLTIARTMTPELQHQASIEFRYRWFTIVALVLSVMSLLVALLISPRL